jgi:hypothetical protein
MQPGETRAAITDGDTAAWHGGDPDSRDRRAAPIEDGLVIRDAMTTAAPAGVVTFLFTDVEVRPVGGRQTRMRCGRPLWHDDVLRTTIEKHEGFLFSHAGDGVVAAFALPMSAVDAAVAA